MTHEELLFLADDIRLTYPTSSKSKLAQLARGYITLSAKLGELQAEVQQWMLQAVRERNAAEARPREVVYERPASRGEVVTVCPEYGNDIYRQRVEGKP